MFCCEQFYNRWPSRNFPTMYVSEDKTCWNHLWLVYEDSLPSYEHGNVGPFGVEFRFQIVSRHSLVFHAFKRKIAKYVPTPFIPYLIQWPLNFHTRSSFWRYIRLRCTHWLRFGRLNTIYIHAIFLLGFIILHFTLKLYPNVELPY